MTRSFFQCLLQEMGVSQTNLFNNLWTGLFLGKFLKEAMLVIKVVIINDFTQTGMENDFCFHSAEFS
jgi:hypothetical protein